MNSKRLLITLGICLSVTIGYAQISGPATATVGVPVTFSGPAGQQSYTWNKDNPIEIDAATTNISAVKIFDLVGQVQEAKVFYDRGKWWAFTYTWNAPLEVKRYDLGTDPTVPFTGTPDVVYSYTSTARARALAFYHDNTTKKWHAFMSLQGSVTEVVRMDFDSLGGTPVTTRLNFNLPAPLDAGGVIHLDVQVVKEDGEYFLFMPEYNGRNSQNGWCARVDLGNAITNNPVATDVLPPSGAGNATSLAFYKQDGIWYALQVHIGNTLRRYKFTNGLKQAPTVEQVAVTLTGVAGNDKYRIRFVSGDCGKQLLAYIHGSRTIIRLDFNGDITSVPSVTQSIINTATYAPSVNSNVGLDLYVYNNKLYTYLASSSPSAMYNVLLSELPVGTEHIYGAPEYTATFTAPGTYEVQCAANIGASLSPQSWCHTITVAAPGGPAAPGPFVSPVTTVCKGHGNVVYEAGAVSGIDSYEWEYTGTGVTINGSNTFPVSVAAAGGNSVTVNYSASATSGELRVKTRQGSTTSSVATTASITVNSIPTINIIPASVTICAGENAVLTASGATTYSWSPSGGTSAVATVTPTTTTSYTVTGTSQGCSATATRQVMVNALPVVNVSPANVAICVGQSAALTASGADTYVWSPSGGNAATAAVSPGMTTTYTVEGTSTSTGCKNTAIRQVTVNPLPVTQVTVTGGITEVCAGDSVVLTASGSGYNYQWKNGAAVVGGGDRYAARTTGNYKVVATDQASGCSDSTQEIDVRVYDRPVVLLDQDDTSFCEGGVIQLAVTTQDTGLTYVWKQDEAIIQQANAHFLEIMEGGVYKVITGRTAVASCEDSTNEVSVTVHDLPVVETSWDGEKLHATPGFASYQWYAGDQGLAGATDSVYVPAANGGYRVSVADSNGCTASSVIKTLINVSVDGLTSATDIRVYPNPSAGMVYIESPFTVDVQILSADGRVLKRYQAVRSLDLGMYAGGVYFLRILDSKGMTVRYDRILKN